MGGPVLNAGPSLIVGIIIYIGVLEPFGWDRRHPTRFLALSSATLILGQMFSFPNNS